jgi:16S rRNA U1498 N3-methylase RsmE
MAWIIEHWSEIGVAALLLLRVAECIVNLTPTDKDNKVIAFIKEFFKIS